MALTSSRLWHLPDLCPARARHDGASNAAFGRVKFWNRSVGIRESRTLSCVAERRDELPTGVHCSSSRQGQGPGRRWLLGVMGASLTWGQVPWLRALELEQPETDEFDEDELRLVQLFQDATRSVVSIQDLAVETPRNGVEEIVKVEGIGSGFVWDKFGHIVTNYHVVAKLALDSSRKQRSQVSVLGPDGKESTFEAKLIGIDSTRDLAVLKIEANAELLRPIPLGSSEDVRVGQSCFALGNPYGYEHTLTTGVVSGLGREIPSPSGQPIPGAIQTDAAINAGNSGGPLLDSFGRAIGINTATFTRQGSGMSSGVNFAVPVDAVRRIIPRLIVYGTSSKPVERALAEPSAPRAQIPTF